MVQVLTQQEAPLRGRGAPSCLSLTVRVDGYVEQVLPQQEATHEGMGAPSCLSLPVNGRVCGACSASEVPVTLSEWTGMWNRFCPSRRRLAEPEDCFLEYLETRHSVLTIRDSIKGQ